MERMIDPQELEKIADRMSLEIPRPAKPRPRPTQSWRLLKPGQLLRNRERIVMGSGLGLEGSDILPSGTQFKVDRVNSLGAEILSFVTEDWVLIYGANPWVRFHLTRPDWKKQWERVRSRKT